MTDWPPKEHCSNCMYGEFDKAHPNTIPSIHICHNEESEGHGPQPWYWSCDKFVIKDEED